MTLEQKIKEIEGFISNEPASVGLEGIGNYAIAMQHLKQALEVIRELQGDKDWWVSKAKKISQENEELKKQLDRLEEVNKPVALLVKKYLEAKKQLDRVRDTEKLNATYIFHYAYYICHGYSTTKAEIKAIEALQNYILGGEND